ncbi:MAG: DUF4845 domain-containing protein [Gammaproteobacteria bacterium]|nr:DUF4845 domain-containing protein [Gammaproteobacteria bacterium]MDH5593938.1 DUF4845 domain-containing protein [Gammaproteobacteria bacterium]
MKNINKQQGITGIGWLFILVIIGFSALVVLKMTPMYSEYFSVKTSMDSLAKESLGGKSKAQIYDMLSKRLDINDVKRVTREDVEITIRSGNVTVSVDYEARENLIGNVSLVAEFKYSIEGS